MPEDSWTNKVKVGKYTFSPGVEKGKVWIQCDDGEGGDFSEEKLEKLLDTFYTKEF